MGDTGKHLSHRGKFFGLNELFLQTLEIGNVVAEDLFAPRADERVVRRGIEHQDEIGEVVDETARKLLLLVEPALHLATLGNVHQGTLITHYMAAIVANGSSRVQAHNGSAVL